MLATKNKGYSYVHNTHQAPFSAKLINSPPRKPKNSARRCREYLTQTEVDKLRKAARRTGRHGHRDDTVVLMMFRHGLVSEAIALRWEQIDFKQGLLHIRRLKNGLPATHCQSGREGGRPGFSCPSPHAAPWHRVSLGEQRPRHARHPGLPWPCQHQKHRAVH